MNTVGGFGVYAKAIVGAIMAFLGVLLLAVDAGSAGGTGIVAAEWIRAFIALVAAGGVVWGVPNSMTEEQVQAYLAREAVTKKARANASKKLTSSDD